MPSKAILEQKQQVVSELSEKIRNSVSGVVVNYQGITVEDDTKLRKELREAAFAPIPLPTSVRPDSWPSAWPLPHTRQ